jgi:hypothetical protein
MQHKPLLRKKTISLKGGEQHRTEKLPNIWRLEVFILQERRKLALKNT